MASKTIQVLRCQAQQAAMISDYDTEAQARYLRLVNSPNYLSHVPTEAPIVPFAARRDTNKGPVYDLLEALPEIQEPEYLDPGPAPDSGSEVGRLVWDLLKARRYVYSTMPELTHAFRYAGSILSKLQRRGWVDYRVWKNDPRTKRYYILITPGPRRYPMLDVSIIRENSHRDWLTPEVKAIALRTIEQKNKAGLFASRKNLDQALRANGIVLNPNNVRRLFLRLASQDLIIALPYIGAALPEYFDKCDRTLRENYRSILGSRRLVSKDVERELKSLPDNYPSFAEKLAEAASRSKGCRQPKK